MKATDIENEDILEITCEAVEQFEAKEPITEILLLGKFGGIRRILLK